MLALSLDMGGTHTGCAVVRDREVLAAESLAVQAGQGLAPLLPAIDATLRRLLQDCDESLAACAGLAMGFPGSVETRTGTILSTLKKYADAPSLDLAGWSRQTLGLPLRIENDARMALLGEQFAGCAPDARDMVIMTLGTGIGTAAMIEGRLLRGAHAQAGCVGGHTPVEVRGRPCVCGNIGCAEAEAAGWSLPGIVREHPRFAESVLAQADPIDFRALFEAADHGDGVAVEVRQRCLEVWSANAVALIHAYDPSVVVMGGAVMRRADVILPFVRNHVARHAWTSWGKPEVRAAALGERAALLGAVPLLTEALTGAGPRSAAPSDPLTPGRP